MKVQELIKRLQSDERIKPDSEVHAYGPDGWYELTPEDIGIHDADDPKRNDLGEHDLFFTLHKEIKPGSFLDLGSGKIHSKRITIHNEAEEGFVMNGEAIDEYYGWAELRETKDGVWTVAIEVGCEDEEDARSVFDRLHGY